MRFPLLFAGWWRWQLRRVHANTAKKVLTDDDWNLLYAKIYKCLGLLTHILFACFFSLHGYLARAVLCLVPSAHITIIVKAYTKMDYKYNINKLNFINLAPRECTAPHTQLDFDDGDEVIGTKKPKSFEVGACARAAHTVDRHIVVYASGDEMGEKLKTRQMMTMRRSNHYLRTVERNEKESTVGFRRSPPRVRRALCSRLLTRWRARTSAQISPECNLNIFSVNNICIYSI